MTDADLSKLSDLASVQKLFPNDDLGLFDAVRASLKVNESPSFRQFVTDTKNSWSSMQRKHKIDKPNTDDFPTVRVSFFFNFNV